VKESFARERWKVIMNLAFTTPPWSKTGQKPSFWAGIHPSAFIIHTLFTPTPLHV
jgi:hypothetical protein